MHIKRQKIIYNVEHSFVVFGTYTLCIFDILKMAHRCLNMSEFHTSCVILCTCVCSCNYVTTVIFASINFRIIFIFNAVQKPEDIKFYFFPMLYTGVKYGSGL
jgi:hypothetical protein